MSDASALLSVFRPEVRALSAYHVADAAGMVKLDAMENPYQWPEAVKRAWLECLMDCAINRYPDPEARQLAEKIREINAITPKAAILLGNGSDEIIQILLMALKPDATVLSVCPSFVMYRQISLTLGLNYVDVPLATVDFSLDLPAFLDAIAVHQPSIIFLAYPNNPTGNLFDADSIRILLKQTPGLVVIDEAYSPFADASFMGELDDFDNLLVMRTVSKLGLAGLRLGYLAGKPEIVEQLHKVRLPYNINTLTQASTFFALSHHNIFDEQTSILRRERGGLLERMNQIKGIEALPSAANFILFKATQTDATEIFNRLKERKILIKNLSTQGGSLTNYLRVTVGTPEENQLFLEALQHIMTI